MPISNHDTTTASDRPECVITDETNGYYAEVTSDNKLKVDISNQSVSTNNPNTEQVVDFVRNGSSGDLAVDGSTTPVEFKFQPSSGIWAVHSTTIAIGCSSDPFSNGFGGNSILTNGLELKYTINSTTYTIATMICNLCVTTVFHDVVSPGLTDSKWLKDVGGRYYVGTLVFTSENGSIRLDSSDNDKFSAIVNDDLTNQDIDFLTIGYHAKREL